MTNIVGTAFRLSSVFLAFPRYSRGPLGFSFSLREIPGILISHVASAATTEETLLIRDEWCLLAGRAHPFDFLALATRQATFPYRLN